MASYPALEDIDYAGKRVEPDVIAAAQTTKTQTVKSRERQSPSKGDN